MQVFSYLSALVMPAVILYILLGGLLGHVRMQDAFTQGARRGVKTAVSIMPTLIGMLVAVATLRSSGLLEWVGNELAALAIIRMFSSSAATGLMLDLFKRYGTDSLIGMTASVMMSCTETIFYTMSVYFAVVKIRHTRWTLPGALFATAAGVMVSFLLGAMQ